MDPYGTKTAIYWNDSLLVYILSLHYNRSSIKNMIGFKKIKDPNSREDLLPNLKIKKEGLFNFFNLIKFNSKSINLGETIHVFSLASGHLYERFLKIMMVSVSST